MMELAEGMTLKRYIRRYGRLSARETVDFAIQIASGLQAAHEHHIIPVSYTHLKPISGTCNKKAGLAFK